MYRYKQRKTCKKEISKKLIYAVCHPKICAVCAYHKMKKIKKRKEIEPFFDR